MRLSRGKWGIKTKIISNIEPYIQDKLDKLDELDELGKLDKLDKLDELKTLLWSSPTALGLM